MTPAVSESPSTTSGNESRARLLPNPPQNGSRPHERVGCEFIFILLQRTPQLFPVIRKLTKRQVVGLAIAIIPARRGNIPVKVSIYVDHTSTLQEFLQ